MPSEIKEPLQNQVIATGNNVITNDGDYLIGNIAPYPNDYLNDDHIGDSFRVKDTGNFSRGILLELVHPPGGAMRTATFRRPT